MFTFLKNIWHGYLIKQSTISHGQWLEAYAHLPRLETLSNSEKGKLLELAIIFLHKKIFVGAHDFVVTEYMTMIVALQACLPILNLNIGWYDGWQTIVMYPEGFVPTREQTDQYGIVHQGASHLSGEAWLRGPVVLSWKDSQHGGQIDGENLVIHEFAHKLDMLNGVANGFPPLHKNMDVSNWSSVFGNAYQHFSRAVESGIDSDISAYAATSPAEFFAVLSEVFFERPEVVNKHYPEVYNKLCKFYRQDRAEMML